MRVDQLTGAFGHRLAEAGARAREHPWSVVGFGLLAGVWAAAHRKREVAEGVVAATLGTLALRCVRELATYQMTRIAKRWLGEPTSSPSPHAH
jgi:hypothetical protein